MQNKDTFGINEARIDKLIMEIFDYANRVNKIFNQADDLIEKSKAFYDCDSGRKFREKYVSLSDNYRTINQNLLSYARELTTVKKEVTLGGQDLVVEFNKAKK